MDISRSLLGCCLVLAFAAQLSLARQLSVQAHANDLVWSHDHGSKLSFNTKAYCLGWMKNVEANNIKNWDLIPLNCYSTIKKYMEQGQYWVDLSVAGDATWTYLSTFKADGYDAVMFDIDETLLSTLEYQRDISVYGTTLFNSTAFDSYVAQGISPAIKSSLALYNKLKDAGFKLVICTGRKEQLRAVTEKNLQAEGYTDYTELVLKTEEYNGMTAAVYKSMARANLVKEKGYVFRSCVGDQFSDCAGDAKGEDTFKFPNPMYYIK